MSPTRIHRRVTVEKDVLTLARERITQAYDMFDFISVSFSGGKDSTVCLNLCLEEARRRARLPLDVVFLDEEAIPFETEEYVRRVSQSPDIRLRWFALPVKHRNACSPDEPWWYPWDPAKEDKWVRPMPPEALTQLRGFSKGISWPDAPALIYADVPVSVGIVLGVRAQESLARQRLLSMKRHLNWITPFAFSGVEDGRVPRSLIGHLWKAYPIYDWTTEDVWTAPAKMGWDYNRGYDLMEMAGLPPHNQRCAPPFGDEPMQKLYVFKTCFPDVWARMHDRVAGAATAARYATTGLYAYGERPELPEGKTWPEYLLNLIETRDDPKVRKLIALRIRKNIRTHYRGTSDPILDVSHPQTGISWPFLAQIALRGDIYQRKIATLGKWGQDEKKDAAYLEAKRRWEGDETYRALMTADEGGTP